MDNAQKAMIEKLESMPFEEARRAILTGTIVYTGEQNSPLHDIALSWLSGKDAALRSAREAEGLSIAKAANSIASSALHNSKNLTITFIDYNIKRDFDTNDLVGWFKFSVSDSSLVGTPREHSTTHTLKVIITEDLMDYWRIGGAVDEMVTADMTKVSFQIAEDHISNQIKRSTLPIKMPILYINTKNSSTSCPYKISNITYPNRTAFTVDIDNKVNQPLVRCLEDFATHIKSEMRMTFWQIDKTKKQYKWVSQPEQRGKDLLRTYLNGRFGDSLYTFEEISAGAGKIDLYIITPGGERQSSSSRCVATAILKNGHSEVSNNYFTIWKTKGRQLAIWLFSTPE